MTSYIRKCFFKPWIRKNFTITLQFKKYDAIMTKSDVNFLELFAREFTGLLKPVFIPDRKHISEKN